MVYEETKGDLESFLKLYKLAKAKGMSVKQVVNLLAIANNHLPAIEERFKILRNDTTCCNFENSMKSYIQTNNTQHIQILIVPH